MAITLAHVTFDCSEPATLARFWAEALGREVDPVDAGAAAFFASIDNEVADRPSWFFIKVPEAKTVKNRVHVDLSADDRPAEVERLVGLGARALSEHEEWGAVWTVLADPEGNEFCVGERGH
jgi:predicted enzyme related to lactoylglutathione lyase